jgi:hypothetical protein
LKEAVDKVSLLYRVNQLHPAPREVVAKGLGYSGLNGASATAISALNKYGLLEGRGDDLRVSERAMSILHPHSREERVQALRAAASEPKLFADLAERFPGGVHNDELLKNYLLRNGFALTAVTQAIQAYRETSEFVALEAAGYDSPSQSRKEEPPVNTQIGTPSAIKNPTPNIAVHSTQHTEDERVLHRFDFADGGFVEIKVSRDVDAELALQVIEASLPTMKVVTGIETKARKAASDKAAAADERKGEKQNE